MFLLFFVEAFPYLVETIFSIHSGASQVAVLWANPEKANPESEKSKTILTPFSLASVADAMFPLLYRPLFLKMSSFVIFCSAICSRFSKPIAEGTRFLLRNTPRNRSECDIALLWGNCIF